jgi:hypothetical protein
MLSAESNVPLIPRSRAHGGWYKYPWESLAVGDSFFVEGKSIVGVSAQAVNRTKRHGDKYTCRSVIEGGVPGVRVWRVE